MSRPNRRREKLVDLVRSAMSGPNGIGYKDGVEGYTYRIWVTTWILPRIWETHKDNLLKGFEWTTFATGKPYDRKVD